ncbi:DNA alkylation repair protein [Alteribacter natronophilus]|uniref:DNA alkylation repair protein n=1 Tax=Alteribacter natronophilus TaxID=2583810 RepID=UPI00110DF99F|nr:DNA alkylation repair protein [Alteribacter natronophilus]TMW72099.1 DNA alkylation repair protein [Alteribacter natronophilus]
MTWKETLETLFRAHAAKSASGPMEKYMKNNFPFLGIKTPERKVLTKKFLRETAIHKNSSLPTGELKEIWKLPEREFHYTVIEITARMHNVYREEDLAFFEELVTTNSWWDSVDGIAPNIIGVYFQKYPAKAACADKWAVHDNIWLRRTAILYQLKYKARTDEERLFHYCRLNREHPEFFIRKAIGWALREYSKTEPEKTASYIHETGLSNLSRKEGLKHIQRRKMPKGV